MKVFVTGATGFIGTAIVRELIDSGHSVIGLARNSRAAEKLRREGAEVHLGSLDEPKSLEDGARRAQGAIHTAFLGEYERFEDACEIDRQAILALGAGLESSESPLVVTSTLSVFDPGRIMYEFDEARSPYPTSPRLRAEEAAAELLNGGTRVMVIRLPSSVHGNNDPQYVPALIRLAREKGFAAYVGEGTNRWTAVHLLDAARLFRLALENGTPGARYHGVAERGIPFRTIAEAIGKGLAVPVRSLNENHVDEYFGAFAPFARGDYFADNQSTRLSLGWRPTELSLIADLDQGDYFTSIG